jgi:hypothetical protein
LNCNDVGRRFIPLLAGSPADPLAVVARELSLSTSGYGTRAFGMTAARIGSAEIVPVTLIIAATVAYLAAVPYPLGALDEGLFLYEAKRILHGDVFYRDIFEIAAPGAYYLFASAFALFGTTMTVARTTAALVHGGIAALSYVAGRRLGIGRWLCIAVATAQLAVCQAAWPYASPHWVGTLFTVLLLLVLIRRPGLERWRWFVLPGALLGMLAFCQHQKALVMAFGIAAILASDSAIDFRLGLPTRFAQLTRSVLALAAGALLIAIPAFGLLVGLAGVAPVYRCLIDFPLFNYHKAANEAIWGDINLVTLSYARRTFPHLLEWLPIVLLPAVPLAARLWWRRRSRERLRVLGLLVGFCTFSIASIAYHPDFIHLAIIAQPFFLFAALQVQWVVDELPAQARGRVLLGTALSLAALILCAWRLGDNLVRSRRAFSVAADTAFGRVHFRRAQDTRLFRALREQLDASQDRRMFIYPGPPALYLLTGAENPTRYQFLLVPYHDPAQVDEVVRDLERKRVPLILTPPMSNVPDPVVEYANENYRRSSVFGMDLYARDDSGTSG